MSDLNREEAYDAKIRPLMDQIIAACQEHDIGLAAYFTIQTEEKPGLSCSTVISPKEKPPKFLMLALAVQGDVVMAKALHAIDESKSIH